MFEHLDIVAAAVVVIGVIFNSGILVATVRTHGSKLKTHEALHKEHAAKHDKQSEKLEAHSIMLEGHKIKLSTLTAWHQGFTAGNSRG